MNKRVLGTLLAFLTLITFLPSSIAQAVTEPQYGQAVTLPADSNYVQSLLSEVELNPELYENEDASSTVLGDVKPIEVDIIAQNEIAVYVYDAASKAPLKNANVTINETKTVKASTNDKGYVVFTLENITGQPSDKIPDSVKAGLEVTGSGYRSYKARFMRMNGGQGFRIYLTKDDGTPYIEQMTFDGWDFHNHDFEVTLASGNDMDHEIELSFQAKANNTLCTATMLSNGKTVGTATGTTGATGAVTFKFTDKWCKGEKLKAGDKLTFAVSINNGAKQEFKDNCLKVINGQLSQPADTSNNELNPTGNGLNVTLPNEMPAVGGKNLLVKIPSSGKYKIYIDPSGAAFIGINYDIKDIPGYGNDWKNTPKSELTEKFKKAQKELKKSLEAMNKGLYPKRGADKATSKLIGSFETEFDVAAYGLGRYDAKTGYCNFEMMFCVTASAKYQQTQHFTIVVVPVYVGFDIKGEISGAVDFVTQFKPDNPVSTLKVSFGNAGFVIGLKLELGVYAGVGVKKIASVEARGYGWINPVMTVKNSTTYNVTAGAGLDITAQLLLFKYKKEIIKAKWQLYPKGNTSDFGEYNDIYSDITADMQDSTNWVAVTDEDLANTAELSISCPEGTATVENAAQLKPFVNAALSQSDKDAFGMTNVDNSSQITPQTVKLLENMYSDERIQIVQTPAVTLMFRIITANINGKNVTRLAFSRYVSGTWSAPSIVDVTSANHTNDFNDYNYAVVANGNTVRIAIICGKQSADRTIDNAAKDTRILFTRIAYSSNTSWSQSGTWLVYDTVGKAESYIHDVTVCAGDGNQSYVAFLASQNANPLKKPEIDKLDMTYCMRDDGNGTFRCVGWNKNDWVERSTLYHNEMLLTNELSGIFLHIVIDSHNLNTYVLQKGSNEFIMATGDKGNIITSLRCENNGDGKDRLLFIKDNSIYVQEGNKAPTKLLNAYIPSAQFEVTKLENGAQYIYWLCANDGVDMVGKRVKEYSVECVRKIGNNYSAPYTMVDLQTTASHISGFVNSSKVLDIVYTDITSIDKSQATLYHAKTPAVASAQVNAYVPVEPCLGINRNNDVEVRLENRGNMFLKTVNVSLYKEKNKNGFIAVSTVPFSESNRVKQQTDNDKPALENLLSPGETATYKSKVNIPSSANIKGTVTIYADVSKLTSQSKGDGLTSGGGYLAGGGAVECIDISTELVGTRADENGDNVLAFSCVETSLSPEQISSLQFVEQTPQTAMPVDFGLNDLSMNVDKFTIFKSDDEAEQLLSVTVQNPVVDKVTLTDAGVVGWSHEPVEAELTVDVDGKKLSLGSIDKLQGGSVTATYKLDEILGGDKEYAYMEFAVDPQPISGIAKAEEFDSYDNAVLFGEKPFPIIDDVVDANYDPITRTYEDWLREKEEQDLLSPSSGLQPDTVNPDNPNQFIGGSDGWGDVVTPTDGTSVDGASADNASADETPIAAATVLPPQTADSINPSGFLLLTAAVITLGVLRRRRRN